MSNADVVDGISSISGSFQIWGAAFVGALIIFCLGICVYRAKSINFLLDRIWIFFGGKLEFNDKELNNDWEIIRDLELFRYRYGFDVETKDHVRSLRNWLSSNNVNFLELRKISNLFDVRLGRIKKDSFKYDIIINVTLILALVSSIIISNIFLNTNDAQFVVVETEQNFHFDGKKLSIYDEKFSRRQCDVMTAGAYPEPGSDDANKKFNKYIACGIFGVEGKKFYQDTIKNQKHFLPEFLLRVLE
ncbi:DUF6216 family protein [Comamonas sp. AG1104]|uniref:DUF6216 family protein n=1 Tax=Comamonas sp. AG1104 TaxID=2183900 RepID=UPI000E2BC99A|nr:DUF6216 family protein [Comamonas sp. AG1104]RDI12450.1 hypothetical protein DFO48_10367 [Comamonas sp. AG1104]